MLTLNKLLNFYALVSPSGTWAYYDRSYLLGLLGGLDSTYNAPNTASGTRRALRPVTVKCHRTVPSTSPSCLKANAPTMPSGAYATQSTGTSVPPRGTHAAARPPSPRAGPISQGESCRSGEMDNLPAWRRVQRRGRRRTCRGALGPSSVPQPRSPSRSAPAAPPAPASAPAAAGTSSLRRCCGNVAFR